MEEYGGHRVAALFDRRPAWNGLKNGIAIFAGGGKRHSGHRWGQKNGIDLPKRDENGLPSRKLVLAYLI